MSNRTRKKSVVYRSRKGNRTYDSAYTIGRMTLGVSSPPQVPVRWARMKRGARIKGAPSRYDQTHRPNTGRGWERPYGPLRPTPYNAGPVPFSTWPPATFPIIAPSFGAEPVSSVRCLPSFAERRHPISHD
jgi:hypothetical protein